MPDKQKALKTKASAFERYLNRKAIDTFIRKFVRNALNSNSKKIWLLTLTKEIIEIADIEGLSQAGDLSKDIIEVVAIYKGIKTNEGLRGFPALHEISGVFDQGNSLSAAGCVLVRSTWGDNVVLFRFKEKHMEDFKKLNVRPYKELVEKVTTTSSIRNELKRFDERLCRCKDIHETIDVYSEALPWLDFLVRPVEDLLLNQEINATS
jgi:hypothetical protein